MNFSKEYINLLGIRIKYFQDKKITELNREEIEEYLNLRDEVREVFPEISKLIKDTWEELWPIVEPHAKAIIQYNKRVLKNGQ